jgi:hypothetical protein
MTIVFLTDEVLSQPFAQWLLQDHILDRFAQNSNCQYFLEREVQTKNFG